MSAPAITRVAQSTDPSHFVLQQLDYLAFIDIYAQRIRAFHVKDAEFNPTGRQGVYSGFQPWINRPGRFPRSATGRSTSRRSSRGWQQSDSTAGWCYSGNAV